MITTATPIASEPLVRPRPSTVRLGLSRGRLELTSFFRTKEAVFFTFLFPILLLTLFGSIFGESAVPQLWSERVLESRGGNQHPRNLVTLAGLGPADHD